jgi:hypothetical protein
MASRAADTAGSLTLTPHIQFFISQLELTVSSQEYLKELRILLFQRDLYKLPSKDVLKKGNYYFFFYNNYICFKSLYAHDMVICFSVGFSYSVLMWPRFAVLIKELVQNLASQLKVEDPGVRSSTLVTPT